MSYTNSDSIECFQRDADGQLVIDATRATIKKQIRTDTYDDILNENEIEPEAIQKFKTALLGLRATAITYDWQDIQNSGCLINKGTTTVHDRYFDGGATMMDPDAEVFTRVVSPFH